METLMIVRSRCNRPVKDETEIRMIIALNCKDRFPQMIEAIDSYGAKKFFPDLWTFLESQTYRSVLNKYLLFVNIKIGRAHV